MVGFFQQTGAAKRFHDGFLHKPSSGPPPVIDETTIGRPDHDVKPIVWLAFYVDIVLSISPMELVISEFHDRVDAPDDRKVCHGRHPA